MARKKISFWATKKVKKPVRVRFVNQYGELVSFTARRITEKPVKVSFYAKKKKR